MHADTDQACIMHATPMQSPPVPHAQCPHPMHPMHPHQRTQILSGMLEDDSLVTPAKVEALLSCLVAPAVDESPATAEVARRVLRRREREVQPTLQRLLTRLLTSPLTANSGLWEQSYAIVAQVRGRGLLVRCRWAHSWGRRSPPPPPRPTRRTNPAARGHPPSPPPRGALTHGRAARGGALEAPRGRPAAGAPLRAAGGRRGGGGVGGCADGAAGPPAG